jgi:hypothetical protein
MTDTNDLWALRLEHAGAQLFPQALSMPELTQFESLTDAPIEKAGQRIYGGPLAQAILNSEGSFHRLATTLLGPSARPVRAILFDKNADTNWALGWHQDRTIAVRERRDVVGFGPWSEKDGAIHAEPPYGLLRRMVTLRAHLDDCEADNAPLLIAPGSHDLGRIPVADVPATAERLGSLACLAHRGDIWAYVTTILHGSQRVARPRRRRVLQVDYAPEDLPGGLEWLGF